MENKYWLYLSDIVPKNLSHDCTTEFKLLALNNHVSEKNIESKYSNLNQPLFLFLSNPENLIYKYFKTEIKGIKFTPNLFKLKEIAEKIIKEKHGIVVNFDSAFINMYKSGKDYIPPHKDKTHGLEYPIASFSFYENEENTKKEDLRILNIIPDDLKGNSKEHIIEMEHGSLLIMNVGMQKYFKHYVPVTKTDKFRINVTLRVHSTIND